MINDVYVKNDLFFKKKHENGQIHNLGMISSFLTKYFFYYLLVVTINDLYVQYMKLEKVHLEHELENIWTIKIFLHHTLKK